MLASGDPYANWAVRASLPTRLRAPSGETYEGPARRLGDDDITCASTRHDAEGGVSQGRAAYDAVEAGDLFEWRTRPRTAVVRYKVTCRLHVAKPATGIRTHANKFWVHWERGLRRRPAASDSGSAPTTVRVSRPLIQVFDPTFTECTTKSKPSPPEVTSKRQSRRAACSTSNPSVHGAAYHLQHLRHQRGHRGQVRLPRRPRRPSKRYVTTYDPAPARRPRAHPRDRLPTASRAPLRRYRRGGRPSSGARPRTASCLQG